MTIKAKDAAGNMTTVKKKFKTVHEHPEPPERVADKTKMKSSKQTVLTKDPTNDKIWIIPFTVPINIHRCIHQ
nr:hypothetical protein [Bacillus pumilus]